MATAKKDDLGQSEVHEKREEARRKGYEGENPSTIPNEKFALTSGPNSPSAGEQTVAGLEQRAKDARASLTESEA